MELCVVPAATVPLWMDLYSHHTREHVAEYRATTEDRGITTTTINAFEAHLLSGTERLTRMLEMSFKLMPMLASMHWRLVEFRKPILATSDQPVVMWPLRARSRQPAKTPPTLGVFQTIEIRAPLTPHHLILMTWANHPNHAHR